VIMTEGGGAATRASGEQILRGMVPIFGFDLPARTASTTYKTVSRVLEEDPFTATPAMAGTTRKYKFVIRYADDGTTGSTSWSVCPAATADGSCGETFIVPSAGSGNLDKGKANITADITLPAYPWRVAVKAGGSGNPVTLQVYQIFLAAYDEVK